MVSYFGTAWAGLSVFIGEAALMVPYPPYSLSTIHLLPHCGNHHADREPNNQPIKAGQGKTNGRFVNFQKKVPLN